MKKSKKVSKKTKIIVVVLGLLAILIPAFSGQDSENITETTTEIVETTIESQLTENETEEDVTENSATEKTEENTSEKETQKVNKP